jgi:hypothetical protein
MLRHKVCPLLLTLGLLAALGCAQVKDRVIYVGLGTPPPLAKGVATIATDAPVDVTVKLPDGTSSLSKVDLAGMHPISDADLQELGRVWTAYQAEHAPK